MTTEDSFKAQEKRQLVEYLADLDERISRIESYLNIQAPVAHKIEITKQQLGEATSEHEDKLEFEIGQFWFAKVGIVILAIGVAFLLTFPYERFHPIFPSIIGYLIAGSIIGLAYYWRKSFSFLSRYLLGGGLVLLYFSTIRLYFFSPQPVISNNTLEFILLTIVVTLNLIISVRRESIYLTAVSLTMGYITTLISNESFITLISIALLAMVTVYFQLKHQWNKLALYAMILAYWTYILWSLNNPILGNDIHLISDPLVSVYFILFYATIFVIGTLLRKDKEQESPIVIVTTIINSIGSYTLFLLLTHFSFTLYFTLSHIIASILFLFLSVVFWKRERSKYATFFYAMLGYLALSIAIINQYGLSDSLIWLSWQSILVITTAIWFRSKYIVVANFFIYIIVLIAYVGLGSEINFVSMSFGLVALLSARIMNAQQHRLDLKTELMRNAYLGSAFVFFPYALYYMVPREYVSIAWVGVAIVYFTLNLILKKQKYRWMGILTLMLTVGYVFIIGIISLNATYRILSFVVLGIVLVIVSMVYTRMRMKRGKTTE